jgi:hypothetical protein
MTRARRAAWEGPADGRRWNPPPPAAPQARTTPRNVCSFVQRRARPRQKRDQAPPTAKVSYTPTIGRKIDCEAISAPGVGKIRRERDNAGPAIARTRP